MLRTSPERVGPATALDSLGFDSLLALELRNRLELSLGVRRSATLIWNYPNLPALVAYLAGLVVGAAPAAAEGIGINGRPAGAEGAAQGGDDVWSEVEVLSDEAALRELMGDGD